MNRQEQSALLNNEAIKLPRKREKEKRPINRRKKLRGDVKISYPFQRPSHILAGLISRSFNFMIADRGQDKKKRRTATNPVDCLSHHHINENCRRLFLVSNEGLSQQKSFMTVAWLLLSLCTLVKYTHTMELILIIQ